MSFQNNIQVCHRCPRSRAHPSNGGCAGPCPCLADPQKRDIIDIAKAGDCPLKKFKPRRFPLLGDLLATVIRRTGLRWLYSKLFPRKDGKKCGEVGTPCHKRRVAINQVDEKVRDIISGAS